MGWQHALNRLTEMLFRTNEHRTQHQHRHSAHKMQSVNDIIQMTGGRRRQKLAQ